MSFWEKFKTYGPIIIIVGVIIFAIVFGALINADGDSSGNNSGNYKSPVNHECYVCGDSGNHKYGSHYYCATHYAYVKTVNDVQ